MKERQQPGDGRRRTGHARTGLWAAVGSAVLMGAVGVPAAAVAATPPPGRAYELVSPVQKSGNAVAGVVAAGDGGAMFTSIGAFPGASSNLTTSYVARRTASGWATSAVTPPTTNRDPVTQDQFYVQAVSDDFSQAIVATTYPVVDPADQAEQPGFGYGYQDLFGWNGDGAPWSWLTPAATLPEAHGADVSFAAASSDFQHLIFETTKDVDPAVGVASAQQVYERSGGVIRLISRDENGDPLPNGGALGIDHYASYGGGTAFNGGGNRSALSADGQTVFFSSHGAPYQLYVRTHALDPARAATKEISVSRAAANPGQGCDITTYISASQDGRRAYFFCPSQLTDDSPNGGVYEYDVPGDTLRLVAPGDGSSNGAGLLASDADAHHVYVLSGIKLTPDADAAGTNLYVIDDGRIKLVATLPAGGFAPDDKASASADGTRLAFTTAAALDPRANGHREVYVYDSGSGAITCASCRPDGSESQGDATLREFLNTGYTTVPAVAPSGNVTDDGRSVFFTSTDALVPQDVNGKPDAYEVRDGKPYLLSSGTDRYASAFQGASADGTDVYIVTHEDLAPQDIDHGITDVYDVRRGGGFPVAEETRHCHGSDCQGPLATPPATTDPVTDRISGHGDAAPVTRPDFARRAITATMRKQLAAGKKVSIRVKVNQAGTVSVTARSKIGKSTLTVARGSKKATKASTVAVPIKLSATARRRLNAGKKLSVTLSVSFTGVRAADATTLSLKKTKTSKGR